MDKKPPPKKAPSKARKISPELEELRKRASGELPSSRRSFLGTVAKASAFVLGSAAAGGGISVWRDYDIEQDREAEAARIEKFWHDMDEGTVETPARKQARERLQQNDVVVFTYNGPTSDADTSERELHKYIDFLPVNGQVEYVFPEKLVNYLQSQSEKPERERSVSFPRLAECLGATVGEVAADKIGYFAASGTNQEYKLCAITRENWKAVVKHAVRVISGSAVKGMVPSRGTKSDYLIHNYATVQNGYYPPEGSGVLREEGAKGGERDDVPDGFSYGGSYKVVLPPMVEYLIKHRAGKITMDDMQNAFALTGTARPDKGIIGQYGIYNEEGNLVCTSAITENNFEQSLEFLTKGVMVGAQMSSRLKDGQVAPAKETGISR